ncbi:MAG: UDP-N-acetylenolpyruvoylglucosamine reductase [Firmicutes bacterium HGW-Firmicutes-15]|nr:MAG: UDP-N-acetylenolpyruvoylglucosamine reductase [Firmicutes bacterium HGW-Firmicutes-15]
MYSGLVNLISPEIIKVNEPMKDHTTFKIGGPVDVLVLPRNIDEIKLVLACCRENKFPLLVFGQGSNILVRDKGIRGIAIKLGNNLKDIRIDGEEIYAQAGVRLSELARKAAAYSLSGLEFAEGIPGSLGGAVVMNAGAYDGEMMNVVLEVETIKQSGESRIFPRDDIGFNYRTSKFQHSDFIIVGAKMRLTQGDSEEIKAKMREYAHNRKEKQPLEYPSAGSVFKRPPGFYVGPMVEQLGLKGLRIGGAEVSTKHAGFIINRGNAKADDVLELINRIQKAAQEKFAVNLQPEIRVVGEK